MTATQTPMLCALLCAALLTTAGAQAQTFKEPALEALFQAGRTDELQRVVSARVAAQADDAQAVLGLALLALERDDASARPPAIQRAEACIARQPKAAPCHYALGLVLGIQSLSEGMFQMARSAGTVKDALLQAHTLEPGWYRASAALVEFYLLAPGVMGGSSSKAAEVARAAPRPEQAQALQARVALADQQYEKAIQALLSLPASALEPALAEDARNWAVQAGLAMVNNGMANKAQPYFDRLAREQPEQAGPVYGQARVRGEQGAHEDALKLYEQARKLKSAGQWPLQYRIGKSLDELGRKDDAKAAYKRYVAEGKGPAQLLGDAKKRIEQLGG